MSKTPARKPRALPAATHWFFARTDRQLRHGDWRHIEIGRVVPRWTGVVP